MLSERSSREARDPSRFLRPTVVWLTASIVAAISLSFGSGLGHYGRSIHKDGGTHLQETVVDDIFHQADKDNDGVIGGQEIQSVSSADKF